jgi:hypothetical protein
VASSQPEPQSHRLQPVELKFSRSGQVLLASGGRGAGTLLSSDLDGFHICDGCGGQEAKTRMLALRPEEFSVHSRPASSVMEDL